MRNTAFDDCFCEVSKYRGLHMGHGMMPLTLSSERKIRDWSEIDNYTNCCSKRSLEGERGNRALKYEDSGRRE